VPAGDDDLTMRQRRGTLQLVAGEENGGPGSRRLPDEGVEDVAPGGIEPGMGLVEEPEAGVADEERGEGGATALPGGEPAHGDVADAAVGAGAGQGDVGIGAAAHGLGPEPDVLGDGEVVVEPGGRTEQGDVAADRTTVAPQVDAEDGGLAPHDGQQPGDGPQQGGLAGAVGPAQEHDLPGVGVEIDASKGGETAQEADRGAEADDGVHGDRGKRYRRPSLPSKTTVIGGIGRLLIGFGVLVLLFVAYELWGTNLHEARAQEDLKRDVAEFLASVDDEQPTSTTVPVRPVPGDAVALIQIPEIGVEKAVVEGVSVGDLKKGPGHYPKTPMPGQTGNAAIAGHRTTYGAPFGELGELEAGDEIYVTTRQGRFVYRVDSRQVVKPTQMEVLDPTFGATLTLTTCHPKFSARQRLVVTAFLEGEPAPPPPTTTTTEPPDEGEAQAGPDTLSNEAFGGDRDAALPAVLWGLLAFAVGLVVWLLARRLHRLVYLPGAVAVLVVLFFFFERLANALPPGI
jgi:sortase A